MEWSSFMREKYFDGVVEDIAVIKFTGVHGEEIIILDWGEMNSFVSGNEWLPNDITSEVSGFG